MKLKDILIDSNFTIKEAVERLETVRCKVVYIVDTGELRASVSDGDVRRFILRDGDLEKNISEIANFAPKFFNEGENEKIKDFFNETEAYSVPIVNYYSNIIAIVFRDGRIIKEVYELSCPVVIMAGGKGTRLYPYTKVLPKALIPIGEVPITERIIHKFCEYSCKEFYFIVNHKKEMIKAYYNSILKEYNIHFIEESKPLGTGGGLALLKGKLQQDFFVTNCDVMIEADYAEIFNFHRENKDLITIVAAEYHQVIPYGVIKRSDDGSYKGSREKPSNKFLINTGLYVVSGEVIEQLDDSKEISFPQIIDKFYKDNHKIGVYVVPESSYMDMGQMEELAKMQERLNGKDE